MHPNRPKSTAPDLVCYVLLSLIVVGVLLTPALPFLNRPTLWFGLPPILVWMVLLVLAVTPVLAVLEARRHDDEEDRT